MKFSIKDFSSKFNYIPGKDVLKRSFSFRQQIKKSKAVSKLPFVLWPRYTKFKVVLKRLFVFWIQATKIELIYFFSELLVTREKPAKLLANSSQNIFENTKKEFFFFVLVLVFVALAFWSLIYLLESYYEMITSN